MRAKDDSVDISKLHPLIKNKLPYLDEIYEAFGEELVITSGHEDSALHKDTSKHYIHNNLSGYGHAIDIRTFTIPPDIFWEVYKKIQYYFPRPKYRVIYEGDHFHIGLYEEQSSVAEVPPRHPDEIPIESPAVPVAPKPLPKVGFPRNHKRVVGIIVTLLGEALTIWQPVAGQLVRWAGSALATIGVIHAPIKSDRVGKADDIRSTIAALIRVIVDLLKRLTAKK